MNSLVAGAAGFLGSNLARALLGMGHKVIGIDNFLTSHPGNIEDLLVNPNFTFVNESVEADYTRWLHAPIDLVLHFASPASPPKYQALPLETIDANTMGTRMLAQLALDHGARLVFASTSEVYGDPQVSPQTEAYFGNVNPIGPRSMYDESKRLGESLVAHFVREEGLDGSIIRIFNTYGPGMDPFDGRVVSTFIRQALQGEPFTVFGDGSQTRSFCYVDDLVRGVIQVSSSIEFGPVNLGNDVEIDLITLGVESARAVGVDPKFQYLPLPQDDPRHRRPDLSMAAKLFGWEPRVSLREGLQLTAEWMKDIGRIEG